MMLIHVANDTCFLFVIFFSTDQVTIPDFAAGAMKNWGLILYREPALLYNPDFSTTADKQFVEEVVAHELGHMVRDTEILSVLQNQQETSENDTCSVD